MTVAVSKPSPAPKKGDRAALSRLAAIEETFHSISLREEAIKGERGKGAAHTQATFPAAARKVRAAVERAEPGLNATLRLRDTGTGGEDLLDVSGIVVARAREIFAKLARAVPARA